MSTDADAASRRGDGGAVAAETGGTQLLEAPDVAQIARQLTEKYGVDALAFAEGRAERASEVGDMLALAAWQAVIAATQRLLQDAHI